MSAASDPGDRERSLAFFGAASAGLSHEINNVLAIINELSGLIGDVAAAADRAAAPPDAALLRAVPGRISAHIDPAIRFRCSTGPGVDGPDGDLDAGRGRCLAVAPAGAPRTCQGHPRRPAADGPLALHRAFDPLRAQRCLGLEPTGGRAEVLARPRRGRARAAGDRRCRCGRRSVEGGGARASRRSWVWGPSDTWRTRPAWMRELVAAEPGAGRATGARRPDVGRSSPARHDGGVHQALAERMEARAAGGTAVDARRRSRASSLRRHPPRPVHAGLDGTRRCGVCAR